MVVKLFPIGGVKTTRIQLNFDNSLVIGGMNSLWDTSIFDQINYYQSCHPKTAIQLGLITSEDLKDIPFILITGGRITLSGLNWK